MRLNCPSSQVRSPVLHRCVCATSTRPTQRRCATPPWMICSPPAIPAALRGADGCNPPCPFLTMARHYSAGRQAGGIYPPDGISAVPSTSSGAAVVEAVAVVEPVAVVELVETTALSGVTRISPLRGECKRVIEIQ